MQTTPIWEALEPMLNRRRTSQFIRGAVAHALGIDVLPPVVTPALAAEQAHAALSSGVPPRAKRPTSRASLDDTTLEGYDGPDDLDQATDNFLSMFGK
jgi:hypothetical protein